MIRVSQIIQCELCEAVIHRECFPNRGKHLLSCHSYDRNDFYFILSVITKQEYVKMKRDGEKFNFICYECVPEVNEPPSTKSTRRKNRIGGSKGVVKTTGTSKKTVST